MTDAIELFNRAAQAEIDAIETRRLAEEELHELRMAVLGELNPGDELPEWVLQVAQER